MLVEVVVVLVEVARMGIVDNMILLVVYLHYRACSGVYK